MNRSNAGAKLDPLTLEWYKKLADSGFQDIECHLNCKEPYYRAHTSQSQTMLSHLKRGFHQEHFRILGFMRFDEKFLSEKNVPELTRRVLFLHADGYSAKEIAKEVGKRTDVIWRIMRTEILPLVKEYRTSGRSEADE